MAGKTFPNYTERTQSQKVVVGLVLTMVLGAGDVHYQYMTEHTEHSMRSWFREGTCALKLVERASNGPVTVSIKGKTAVMMAFAQTKARKQLSHLSMQSFFLC